MSARRVELAVGADIDGFRRAVRGLVAAQIPPERVFWATRDSDSLFGATPGDVAPPLSLPRAVATLIGDVVPHSDPERYALLYDVIWRAMHGQREICEHTSDPVVHRLDQMRKSVRRDIHKMHAYVRFRKLDAEPGDPGPERFVAWFEPDHYILEAEIGRAHV